MTRTKKYSGQQTLFLIGKPTNFTFKSIPKFSRVYENVQNE